MTEILDQLRKLQKRLEGQLRRRRRQSTRRSAVPVGPLTPHSYAAAHWLPQDQRLGPRDASGLQNREALPSKRVEGVANLSPSQRIVGNLGSSH